jgi:hypothetical protein
MKKIKAALCTLMQFREGLAAEPTKFDLLLSRSLTKSPPSDALCDVLSLRCHHLTDQGRFSCIHAHVAIDAKLLAQRLVHGAGGSDRAPVLSGGNTVQARTC